jgi:hypothetical protein
MQRPPYLRWVAALLLVAGAAAWDLRPRPTEMHPFLARDVGAGDVITEEDLEWRAVPSGLLAVPDLSAPAAAVDLHAGDPLLDPLLRRAVAVPGEWWGVPVTIGSQAAPGDPVLLVVTDPPTTISGIVVTAQRGDPYALDFRPATVAVPADAAALVAAASAKGLLVAAVRPSGSPADG